MGDTGVVVTRQFDVNNNCCIKSFLHIEDIKLFVCLDRDIGIVGHISRFAAPTNWQGFSFHPTFAPVPFSFQLDFFLFI